MSVCVGVVCRIWPCIACHLPCNNGGGVDQPVIVPRRSSIERQIVVVDQYKIDRVVDLPVCFSKHRRLYRIWHGFSEGGDRNTGIENEETSAVTAMATALVAPATLPAPLGCFGGGKGLKKKNFVETPWQDSHHLPTCPDDQGMPERIRTGLCLPFLLLLLLLFPKNLAHRKGYWERRLCTK